MATQIKLGDIAVEVVKKDIKNVHLSVYPPGGRVRISAPLGSCTRGTRSIRLNTDLAKKPPECLEYIVVHEMVHLLEPTHNSRFTTLMDQFLPNWRFSREELNRLPVRHEKWGY
jgi:predicted metal-dependent hydrolase